LTWKAAAAGVCPEPEPIVHKWNWARSIARPRRQAHGLNPGLLRRDAEKISLKISRLVVNPASSDISTSHMLHDRNSAESQEQHF
jgi:hypothetical protein